VEAGKRQRQLVWFAAAMTIVACVSLAMPTALDAQAVRRGPTPQFLSASADVVPARWHAQYLAHLPPTISLPADELGTRLVTEYGAMLVARGVVLPPTGMFLSEEAVAEWQKQTLGDGAGLHLQPAAQAALASAREEAARVGLTITARSDDSGPRRYHDTLDLWTSRVEPGLAHWVKSGRLGSAEVNAIRNLTPHAQTRAILQLERAGMFFSKDFSKSILSSVAPPGASQHLALLAYDVKEHDDPRVRAILARHGWHQTVVGDLPHFPYLGAPAAELKSLGLINVDRADRMFWVPRHALHGDSDALLASR